MQFYNPYEKLGSGDYQKWKIGDVYIGETRYDAYRVFIKSLATDNPFLSRNYVETLKRLPQKERKRLLLGDWNSADDEDSLFQSDLLDRCTIYDLYEHIEDGSKERFIGVDVADKGKDKTIVTLIVDGVCIKQQRLEVDTSGEKPISHLYADELVKFAQQNGFRIENAKNIAIEGNGVGVGMRDAIL